MTIRLILCSFIFLIPSIAFSATPEQQQVYLQQCESLLRQNTEISDGTRDFYISRITSWGENTSNIEGAIRCLRGLTGSSSWNFDPRTSTILNADIQDYQERVYARRCEIRAQLMETQEVFDEILAYDNQRMITFRRQTYEECNALYENNRSAALLNPICHDIFSDIGVPLDRPASLSDDRISEARRKSRILQEEMSIIERHGILPEDYLPKNAEDEMMQTVNEPEAEWWEDCP